MNPKKSIIRPTDLAIISCFGGSVLTFLFVLFFEIFFEYEELKARNYWHFAKMLSPTVRILLIISYIPFGAGLNVMIFRKYGINYMEIF